MKTTRSQRARSRAHKLTRAHVNAQRIQDAEAAIRAAGFTLRYVEYCEDTETPGLLGYYAGVTNQRTREVKVSTRAARTLEAQAAILEHELHHVLDPAWDCGNRSVLSTLDTPT